MTRVARAAYFLPPLVCLIVFWRVPFTWFISDDFAWLSLPLQVHGLNDFWDAVFTPRAQGTVRVLSERLFFLVFSSLFGLHALPYRLWILGVWFADLTLAALIGERLTGSRAAGVVCALLWTTSARIVTTLAWASAYNEVLCAFFVLSAFYARLRWLESGQRKWMAAEWSAYLAGFGALELIVIYPAIVILHALLVARKQLGTALALLIPAAVFSAVHLLFIPKHPAQIYAFAIDRRLFQTFGQYLAWALGPSGMGDYDPRWRLPGLIVTGLIGVALAAFAAWRLRCRDRVVVFCAGWFVILLAPVLPLVNHVSDYYLTIPIIGLAWLAGWAFVVAWQAGASARVVAVILVALYLAGSIYEIQAATQWYFDLGGRMRALVRGVEDSMRRHPGSAVLLQGVDARLFQEGGFQDDPFHLVGAERVYLAPGTEKGIAAREDLGGTTRFRISQEQAMKLLERGQARVLDAASGGARDVTQQYEIVARAEFLATHRNFVDVGDPVYTARLGPTWHSIENGFRWMPKTATIQLSGPASADEKLHVTGYAPAVALASGPVTLRFQAAGHGIGSATLRTPAAKFALEFPLPADLVGQYAVEISVEANKVFRVPGDGRELGMVFGTFSIR